MHIPHRVYDSALQIEISPRVFLSTLYSRSARAHVPLKLQGTLLPIHTPQFPLIVYQNPIFCLSAERVEVRRAGVFLLILGFFFLLKCRHARSHTYVCTYLCIHIAYTRIHIVYTRTRIYCEHASIRSKKFLNCKEKRDCNGEEDKRKIARERKRQKKEGKEKERERKSLLFSSGLVRPMVFSAVYTCTLCRLRLFDNRGYKGHRPRENISRSPTPPLFASNRLHQYPFGATTSNRIQPATQ